jgi:hypothetical protein
MFLCDTCTSKPFIPFIGSKTMVLCATGQIVSLVTCNERYGNRREAWLRTLSKMISVAQYPGAKEDLRLLKGEEKALDTKITILRGIKNDDPKYIKLSATFVKALEAYEHKCEEFHNRHSVWPWIFVEYNKWN